MVSQSKPHGFARDPNPSEPYRSPEFLQQKDAEYRRSTQFKAKAALCTLMMEYYNAEYQKVEGREETSLVDITGIRPGEGGQYYFVYLESNPDHRQVIEAWAYAVVECFQGKFVSCGYQSSQDTGPCWYVYLDVNRDVILGKYWEILNADNSTGSEGEDSELSLFEETTS